MVLLRFDSIKYNWCNIFLTRSRLHQLKLRPVGNFLKSALERWHTDINKYLSHVINYTWIYYRVGLKHNLNKMVSDDWQSHFVINSSIIRIDTFSSCWQTVGYNMADWDLTQVFQLVDIQYILASSAKWISRMVLINTIYF